MDGFSWSLLLAAAGVGLVHTALGPDHYLPFVMLARARGWSRPRTAAVAGACGVGHVVSSLLLGLIGCTLGLAAGALEAFEASRGSLAAWALVAFGVAYCSWGVRKAIRRARGLEPHAHGGSVHVHRRGNRSHDHPPSSDPPGRGVTFWALLAVFVLGPCEPLIPLFMLPAGRGRWGLAALTAATFAVVTVATMVGLALIGAFGLRRLQVGPLERWDHALAGGIIVASGLAILFLGL